MIRSRWRLLAVSSVGLFSWVAEAEQRSCDGPLDPGGAVRCALARSPEVAAAREELAAVAGLRTTAGTLLPAHPEVSGSISRRTAPDAAKTSAVNWTVTLAQELEVPGKRAARLAEVDAERAAALRRAAAAEQDAASAALSALFAVAATDEAIVLATDLERATQALATAMAARAGEGLIPPIEADLAAAEAVRLSAVRLETESRRAGARAALAALLGSSSAHLPAIAPDILATEAPLDASGPEALVTRALASRADLAAAAAERQAARARVERLRRQRVPNFVISVFAQRDGFDERVLGAGLSVPLFLPAPLGPSGRGEVQEAEARRSQGDQRLEAVRRRVREEVERALATWQARRSALDRYPAALVTRARQHVASLADAIQSRQLAPREALIAQRSFIELLQMHLEARLAEAVARVELMRAAALPFPGVSP